MESSVETLDAVTRKLAVTVPAEKVAEALEASYRRINQRVKIDGFRPGRAPRALLEARYRHQAEAEALDALVGPALEEAYASHGLEAVGRPLIEGATIRPGEPLRFTATVQVVPEFELKALEGEAFTKKVVRVTEEDIEQGLHRLAEQNAAFESSDQEALEEGDYAVIDFSRLDGEGSVKAHPLIVGQGALHPAFEAQLLGARRGETREVTIPPEEGEPEKRFLVTIQEVKKKRLPSLDDEFARTLGRESLEDLREDLRRQMEQVEQNRAQERLRSEVARRLVELHPMDLPSVLVEEEIRAMLGELRRHLAHQGRQLEEAQIESGELPEKLREPARERVIRRLVLERVARERGIEPTEEDVQAEIDRLARGLQRPALELRREMESSGALEGLRRELRRRLAMDRLLEEVSVTEEMVDRKDVED